MDPENKSLAQRILPAWVVDNDLHEFAGALAVAGLITAGVVVVDRANDTPLSPPADDQKIYSASVGEVTPTFEVQGDCKQFRLEYAGMLEGGNGLLFYGHYPWRVQRGDMIRRDKLYIVHPDPETQQFSMGSRTCLHPLRVVDSSPDSVSLAYGWGTS